MLKSISILFTALFIILSLGCGKQESKPVVYPTWYTNPPQNSATTLYGVADGNSVQDAKRKALAAISESLLVTINSSNQNTQASVRTNGNEQTLSSSRQSVKSATKQISFTNAKITQQSALNYRYQVLVEVDKQTLFTTQKSKLDAMIDQATLRIENSKEVALFTQFITLKSTLSSEKEAMANVEILTALNASFDATYVKQFYKKSTKELANLKKRLRIGFTSDALSKGYVNTFSAAITAQGLSVVASNRANTLIKLSATELTSTIYGYKVANVTLNISVVTSQGSAISQNNLKLSGKSKFDYIQARAQSAKVLNKRITQEGIFTLLGVKDN